jgi:hypothetical protein
MADGLMIDEAMRVLVRVLVMGMVTAMVTEAVIGALKTVLRTMLKGVGVRGTIGVERPVAKVVITRTIQRYPWLIAMQ